MGIFNIYVEMLQLICPKLVTRSNFENQIYIICTLICMESGTDQLKKRDLPYISDAAWSRTPCTTLHSTILLQPFAVPKART